MISREGHTVQAPDFADMQGLVRFGHGRLIEAEFLLLRISDAPAAKAWMSAAPVTTAEWQDEPPTVALQIALTAGGLEALGVPSKILAQFAQEFLAGMNGDPSRSRRLGDTGTNAPENWSWNGADVHALLMLYAEPDGLDAFKATVMNGQFDRAFDVVRRLATTPNDGTEPFGFADGISEPRIDWNGDHPPSKHGRKEYANILASGEVVLGHRNEYDELSASPLVDGYVDGASDLAPSADGSNQRDLGRNGSYLVLRHLEQDVPGFWQFLDSVADGDAGRRDILAAAMVGRKRDGTPLMHEAREVLGSTTGQDFTFAGDTDGTVCPIGAHIRRANPRTGDHPPGVDGRLSWLLSTLGFRRRQDRLPGRHDLVASTRFHRLVRRGRVFGPRISPEDALKSGQEGGERGLYFICLCANIVRQFEFVQNAWISAPNFDGLSGEADPLLGSREPMNGLSTDNFSIQRTTGVADKLTQMPQFVTVRGGAYFFLPGLRALRFITRQPG